MQKDYPIFTLIKSMNAAEKSYFKKYAFKRISKNNDDYKRIFDLIDKQSTFDIVKIKADKKISSVIKKNLQVNFNHLQKKIVQSLVDLKKSNSTLSQIFENVLEFKVFKEKKMFTQAKRSLKAIDKLIVNDDFFLLKPFIHFLPFGIIRESLNKNTKERETQTKIYNKSVDEFNLLSATRIIGLNIEKLFLKNSGVALKTEADKIEAKLLMKHTKELLLRVENDFQQRSILTNNLFILITMIGKVDDFDILSTSFIAFYKKNVTNKGKATEIYDFLVILINLAVISSYFDKESIFNQSIEILKIEIKNINEEATKNKLFLEIYQLELLNFSLHKELNISDEILKKFQQQHKTIDNKTIHFINFTSFISVILLRKKQYNELLDFSSQLMQTEVKETFKSSYFFIKTIRAIAWLKKENLQMFDYEINSIYKYFSSNNLEFSILVINYLKKLSQKPERQEKSILLKKIKNQFIKMKSKSYVAEIMIGIKYINLVNIEDLK